MNPDTADLQAFARMSAVAPGFEGLAVARDAMTLPPRTVLHAGPPFRHGQPIAAPIRNSARVAAVFEGWARDFDEAGRQLDRGDIQLVPAQDYDAVVPLASVLSPGMRVQIVRDGMAAGTSPVRRFFSPLNGGSGPAMRLGQCTDAVLAHLRWLNDEFAECLSACLAAGSNAPLPLLPIADAALAAGDDCHGRTAAATRLLTEHWAPRWVRLAERDRATRARTFLDASPSFFLNLWMAACQCMLAAAQGEGSSLLIAAGGNGVEFGIQVGGLPGQWWQAPVAPPRTTPATDGGAAAPSNHLPAIGDSAVVDVAGFGALAMHHAPQQAAALAALMPMPSESLADTLCMGSHPAFVRAPIRTGLAARRVVASAQVPAIALGILDRTGERGRLAGGIALAPLAPFAEACAGLDRA